MNPTSISLAASIVAALVLPGISDAAEWKHPKTPWGDPDLQGTWPISHLMSVPLQRDKKYGERLEFTPEELAEQRKAVEAQNQRYSEEDKTGRISMGHWVEATDLPAQTSLIIDPPDGQLPAQTALGKEMSGRMGSDWNRDVFDSVADFGTWNRCITRGLPQGMFPNPYNNGIQIVHGSIRTPGIHIKVPKPDGTVEEWRIEGGAPSLLLRRGWNRNSLPAGTKIVVNAFPARDGDKRASPRDISFPDGRKLDIGSS
jgi:hypothetical protein